MLSAIRRRMSYANVLASLGVVLCDDWWCVRGLALPDHEYEADQALGAGLGEGRGSMHLIGRQWVARFQAGGDYARWRCPSAAGVPGKDHPSNCSPAGSERARITDQL